MAMVDTPDALFAAGTPDIIDTDDPWGALEGRKGGKLMIISKEDGKILQTCLLEAAPVLDGLSAAHGRLFVVLKNGQVKCMGAAAGTSEEPSIPAIRSPCGCARTVDDGAVLGVVVHLLLREGIADNVLGYAFETGSIVTPQRLAVVYAEDFRG